MDVLVGILAMLVVMTLVIFVTIAALSWALGLVARPKGADLAFLTSGHPGEALLDFRVANALIKGASPNFAFDFIMEQMGGQMVSLAASTTFKVMGEMMNGLWVGGRVFVTTHRVVFMPNVINRATTDGLQIVSIDLKRVLSVSERFGVMTRIADIDTDVGKLSVRAPKMPALVSQILKARNALAST